MSPASPAIPSLSANIVSPAASSPSTDSQTADFSAVLAALPASDEHQGGVPVAATNTDATLVGLPAPATSGRILPDALPVDAEKNAIVTVASLITTAASQCARAKRTKVDGTGIEAAADTSVSEPAVAQSRRTCAEESQPQNVSMESTGATLPVSSVMPSPASDRSEKNSHRDENPDQGALRRNVPVLPEQASDRAAARAALHQSQSVEASAGVSEQPAEPAKQYAGPGPAAPTKPAEEVRIAIPASRTPSVEGLRRSLLAKAPDEVAVATPSALPASHRPFADAAAGPAIVGASVSPHDFAALVDRLASAREAVQPERAALVVLHHEFGPVNLRFRTDDSVLSVAMTSADPDFARAAAANPIGPVASAAQNDQAGASPQRDQGEAASQRDPSRSSGRQADHHDSRRNNDRSDLRSSGKQQHAAVAHEHGIFA